MILENNQRIFLNCHENLYKKRSNGIFCGFPNLQDFHQNGSTFLWNFAVIFLSSNSSHISTCRIIISHKLVSYIFFAILVNIYWKLCQIRGYDRQFCQRKTKFKPVNFFQFLYFKPGYMNLLQSGRYKNSLQFWWSYTCTFARISNHNMPILAKFLEKWSIFRFCH